jgi:hypothetical protein
MYRGGEVEALKLVGSGDDRGESKLVASFRESLTTIGSWVESSERPPGASLRFFVDAVVKREGLPMEPMELQGQAEGQPENEDA